MKQWYEELFENYGLNYDKENFTFGTIGECDFIEEEIQSDKTLRILDIGCGTGRHSLELAKRGYNVTGVDLSASQLQRANEKAIEKGLNINFFEADARELGFSNEFDLIIMQTDEMNFQILKNASNALSENGKIIFTTLNGLFPLFHSVKDFLASHTEDGNASYHNNSFDLMTFRDYNTTIVEDDSGNKKELNCNERYYVPCEITWLLKSLGFKVIDIFGAKLGNFSRNDKLTTEDFEMLVIAKK
jgi:2-polyprenyl-3-methyl-5-hydroxy-6-metoxy-1,4-benzoquinol methylase